MCAAPMGMTAIGGQRADGDVLAAWAEGLAGHRGGVRGRGCLRFAFYAWLRLTYHPGRGIVEAQVQPADCGFFESVRGGT
jgi:hypothetical protein